MGGDRPASRRRLSVRLPLACEQEVVTKLLRSDPTGWLPSPARRNGSGVWTVTLRAGPAARTVNCRVGSAWLKGEDCWRSVSWWPTPQRGDVVALERMLPIFTGELGANHDGQRTDLVLQGSYRPPGGRVGAVIDAAALHGVAKATGASFLTAIAQRAAEDPVRHPH